MTTHVGMAEIIAAVPDIGDKPARELAIAVTAYAQGEADERARWTEVVMAELDGNGQAQALVAYATRERNERGRHDRLRLGVHGSVAVGGDSRRAVAGGELPSLADRLWASEEVMGLNAELGLTMDQLARLSRAILGPNVALSRPAREV